MLNRIRQTTSGFYQQIPSFNAIHQKAGQFAAIVFQYPAHAYRGFVTWGRECLDQVELYFYGDFYTICTELIVNRGLPKTEEAKQVETKQTENREQFAIADLGYRRRYHAAVFDPLCPDRLKTLLDQVEKEKKARTSYDVLNRNGFFLLANTGSEAIEYRQLVLQILNPEQCARIAHETVLACFGDKIKFNLKTNPSKTIIHTILTRLFLGIDELPQGLLEVMDELDIDFEFGAGRIAPQFFKCETDYNQSQKKYAKFIVQFFDRHLDKIKEEFKLYPNFKKPNLILLSLIHEIRKKTKLPQAKLNKFVNNLSKEQIRKYLHSSNFIKTIPMLLLAGKSMRESLTSFFESFKEKHPSQSAYKKHESYHGSLVTSLEKELCLIIDPIFEGDIFSKISSLPFLDLVCRESIRAGHPSAILRYTQKGVTLPEMKIENGTFPQVVFPPRTMIRIGLPDCSPFSEGPRPCPANMMKAADAILKSIFATLVKCYDSKVNANELEFQFMRREFENVDNFTINIKNNSFFNF